MRQLGRLIGLVGRIFYGPLIRDLRRQLLQIARAHRTTLEALAPLLVETLVRGEDRRFYWHAGVDPIAICRAAWKTIFRGKLEGGSTIEQQLVRRLTGRFERTLSRKLSEVVLAATVSDVIPKEAVPGLYLSVAYFGWRANGIAEACDRYSVDLSDPTVDEAAALVARIAYPEPQLASEALLRRIERRKAYLIARLRGSARAAAPPERGLKPAEFP